MHSFLKRLHSKSGQQMSEFSLIFVLVGISIIVMSYYVVRGWNANLKGTEESVRDSYQDPLVEKEQIEPIAPSCSCWWEMKGCGIGTCLPTQQSEIKICNTGIICEPGATSRCAFDESCCTAPSPTGNCGALANPPCTFATERRTTKDCGKTTGIIGGCVTDTSCGAPGCLNSAGYTGATTCKLLGDTDDETNLVDYMPYTLVADCGTGPTGNKCEMRCNDGSWLNIPTNSCSGGTVNVGTCNSGPVKGFIVRVP
jgi:hypothetical protein